MRNQSARARRRSWRNRKSRRLLCETLESRQLLAGDFGTDPVYNVTVIPDVVYRDDAEVGYGTPGGVTEIELKLDLYVPNGAGLPRELPAALLIHGGGFTGGTKSQANFVGLANDFASRGYLAASIDYRLFDDNVPPAPANPPYSDLDPRYDTVVAATEDTFHAIAWLKDIASTIGVDADRIVLGGHSAGGFLSTMAGMFDVPDVPPFGLDIDISGLDVAAVLDGAGSLSGLELTIDSADPPTFILHSSDDGTVAYSNAVAIANGLTAANVPFEFPVITDAGHGLDPKLDTVIDGETVRDQMFDFFQEQLDLKALFTDTNQWSVSATSTFVAEDAANTESTIFSLSGTVAEGAQASVTLNLQDVTTDPGDYENPGAAVVQAVNAYSGPGSLSFSGTGVLTYTGGVGGTSMADLLVPIQPVDDADFEYTESFEVFLTNPAGATLDAAQSTVTIDILDNDGELPAIPIVQRTTDEIELVDELTQDFLGNSFELDFYRNNAYAAGLTGNYTFLVMNPAGDPDAEAPLWVYLHGGGVGYYDDTGTYVAVKDQTEDTFNHEETFTDLWEDHVLHNTFNENTGQPIDSTLKRRIEEGYRVVVVSLSDHDLYSGLGTPYTNSPNPGAEVNGLQATMAAIDYTVAQYATTHVWAHGTSAGSIGVWSLASSYTAEGTPLTGIVADSWIVTPRLYTTAAAFTGEPGYPFGPGFEVDSITDKIGYYTDPDSRSEPEAQIPDRDFREVPSLFINGNDDPFCGGNQGPLAEAVAEGLTNCQWYHDGLQQAIDAQPNSPHEFHNLLGYGHVPTNRGGPANDTVDEFIAEILAGNPAPPFGDPPIPVEWSIATTSPTIDEGAAGSESIIYGLSGTLADGQQASVQISLQDITTTPADYSNAGLDFVNAVTAYSGPGSLAFDPLTGTLTYTGEVGGTSMNDLVVAINPVDDSEVEGTEQLQVSMINAIGAPIDAAHSVVTISILDNDGELPTIPIVQRTTDEIELVDGLTQDFLGNSFELDFYRNNAYAAGLTGNYTFLVVNPRNGDETTEAPLWVYLHGGGSGYFDETGDYLAVGNQDENTWNHEETFTGLWEDHVLHNTFNENTGQPIDSTLKRRIDEGYRVVVVSLSDHDQYLGLGTPYPNNPNAPKEVNGMQATMAAIDYIAANHPTTHVFAHGTSAGSVGAYFLALSYSAEGIGLTGIVSDSVVSVRGKVIQEVLAGTPGFPQQEGYEPAAFDEKVGFYRQPENQTNPEARIAAGFDLSPLLFVGGLNDRQCGATFPPLPESVADGFDNNCEWVAAELIDVISAQPDSPHEVALFEGEGHVPTNNVTPANDKVDEFIGEILAGNPAPPFGDPPIPVEWSIATTSPTIFEDAAGTESIIYSLSGVVADGATASVTVNLQDVTTDPSDYEDTAVAMLNAVNAYNGPGTLAFSAGVLTYTGGVGGTSMTDLLLPIQPVNDTEFEYTESAEVSLINPSGSTVDTAQTLVTISILDDDGTALDRYVAKPDASFDYELIDTIVESGMTTYVIDMTSQTWRSLAEVDRPEWEHEVYIFVPDGATSDTAILFIGSGDNGDPNQAIRRADALANAEYTGQVTVYLPTVPNQSLTFTDDGIPRREDEILAYSFAKFLDGGDDEWPVLLPMVKSAVRAMDTAQEFLADNTAHTASDFYVTGGSKRGWTTYLTAAVDPRVSALAPRVFDYVNAIPTLEFHQHVYDGVTEGTVGGYAETLQSYFEFGVFDDLRSPEFAALGAMIDPYSYLDRLTQPKFAILSTGDQFMPMGSQFYVHDFQGPTYLRYIPNTSHSGGHGESKGFFKALDAGETLPTYNWTVEGASNNTIRLNTATTPVEVNLWQATNPDSLDFRLHFFGANFTSTPLTDQGGGEYVGTVQPPATGGTAFLIEMKYNVGGEILTFTTEGRIVEPAQSRALGPVNNGIAVDDGAVGTGWILHSVENLFSRLAANQPYPGNSEHLIAVRFNGSQWEYNNNSNNDSIAQWHAFTPLATDVLLASVDFGNDTITSLIGQTGHFHGINQGFSSGDLSFQANQWKGDSNEGEFTIEGTVFVTGPSEPDIRLLGAVNNGVAVDDGAVGTGWILHSVENLFSRLAANQPYPGNSEHLIAVRFNGSQWEYNNNSNNDSIAQWHAFTPLATDVLLASVDFGNDTITSLIGQTGHFHGINQGFSSGDLSFQANQWKGDSNEGEFTIEGTVFVTGPSEPDIRLLGAVNNGVAVDDGAVGTGWILHSVENLFSRLAANQPYPGNSEHLIAVRFNGSQWEYNNNSNNDSIAQWHAFTPLATDVLVASVDFSGDTITSLEGQAGQVHGLDQGFISGDLSFRADRWKGSFNDGEFTVEGTWFVGNDT